MEVEQNDEDSEFIQLVRDQEQPKDHIIEDTTEVNPRHSKYPS